MSSSEFNSLTIKGPIYSYEQNTELVVGEVVMWPNQTVYSYSLYPSSSTSASRFLPCNGDQYSTTIYSELYSVISTLHGNNLPELNNVSSDSSSNIFYLRGDSNMSNDSTTLNTTTSNLNGGNNMFQLNNVANHNHTIDFNQTMACNWTVNAGLNSTTVNHNLKTVGNNTSNSGVADDRYRNEATRSSISHQHNTTYNAADSTIEFNIGSTFTRPTNISSTIGIESYDVATQSDYNPYAFNVHFAIYTGY